MSKLQRYFIYGDSSYGTHADEDANGDWVKYEDVKELEEENERLRRRIIELESRNETGFGEWET